VRRTAPLVLLIALAAAGCGSSSGGSGTTTTAAARRDQVAECMRKQGVTLPQRRAGGPTGPTGPGGPGGPGTGGFLFGGGASGQGRQQDPKFQAAAQKCGLNRNAGAARSPQSTPQFKQSIEKFVTCVRKNGYDMPAPNLTGKGPVFDASKVSRNDPKFVKASQKCQSLLARPSQ
jgi:hypothetical protein